MVSITAVRRFGHLLSALALLMACSLPAHAGMVTTDELLRDSEVTAQREALHQALQRDEVRQSLVQLGVSPRAAEARVERLNAGELARLHERVGTLPAGGDLSLVELLLIIILVILIV